MNDRDLIAECRAADEALTAAPWHACVNDLIGGLCIQTVDAPVSEAPGPKINGNPHAFTAHRVIRHGLDELACAPRDYEELQHYLLRQVTKGNEGYIEGVVWWRELDNPEAGLAKVKIRDFA